MMLKNTWNAQTTLRKKTQEEQHHRYRYLERQENQVPPPNSSSSKKETPRLQCLYRTARRFLYPILLNSKSNSLIQKKRSITIQQFLNPLLKSSTSSCSLKFLSSASQARLNGVPCQKSMYACLCVELNIKHFHYFLLYRYQFIPTEQFIYSNEQIHCTVYCTPETKERMRAGKEVLKS